MSTKSKQKYAIAALNLLLSILPAFFWAFLIFGFEDPYVALLSIGAAILHEAGHIACIILQKRSLNLKSVVSGFRINQARSISYDQELTTYLCGPLVNIVVFAIFSLIAPLINGIAWDVAIINLATGLSNLLPIEGYDGYGIIRVMLCRSEKTAAFVGVLKRVSSALTFIFCIFSLYLIDRMGGGYWIFGVFFISTIKCIKDDLEK